MKITRSSGDILDLKEAIKSSYLADGLTEEQLSRLYEIASWKSFQAGEEILKQYDDSNDLMILATGSAHVLTDVGEPIGLIKPGMPMGEVSLLDDKPRSGTVVARHRCEVAHFSAVPLMNVLRQDTEMAAKCFLNISRVLCTRLRIANQNMAVLMALDESDAARAHN